LGAKVKPVGRAHPRYSGLLYEEREAEMATEEPEPEVMPSDIDIGEDEDEPEEEELEGTDVTDPAESEPEDGQDEVLEGEEE
jgi:hypothetical protein